jgi:chemotaxis response regulator CheB
MYVTPPGHAVTLHERTLRVEQLMPVHPVTTINRLFESAAKAYHDRVIGVILSGLLRNAICRSRSACGLRKSVQHRTC